MLIDRSKISLINTNLGDLKDNLDDVCKSAAFDTFNISFSDVITAITETYNSLDVFNSALEKLDLYKKNEDFISNYNNLISREKSNPSIKRNVNNDETGVSQSEYVVNYALIDDYEIKIIKFNNENLSLKNEIESLLATIAPNNLQPKNNTDIAHRGSKCSDGTNNWSIGDNSLEAFENAGKNGFWGAEVDVIQNADGKLVCSHNKVKSGENPASFEDYLDICKKYGMTAIIDMKYSQAWSKEGEDEYVNQIISTIEEKGMMDSCVIQTNNKNDITNIRNNSTDARIWYLGDDVSGSMNFIKENNVECVNIKNSQYAAHSVELLSQNGIDSCVWNVNDANTKNRLLEKGATHVMSDYVLGITPYEEGDEDYNDIVN